MMFSTLLETNFNFSFMFISSSANAFNLEQSKNLLFGEELNSFCYSTDINSFMVKSKTVQDVTYSIEVIPWTFREIHL